MRCNRFRLLAGVVAGAIFVALSSARGDVKLPHVFGDNMVLQRDQALPVWGWDNPGQAVTVSIGDAKETATAGADGSWNVSLPAMAADGKTYSMTVAGSSTVTLKNIAIGEVWLCSGQSNMEMGVANTINGAQEIAQANHPDIRLLLIPMKTAGLPQPDVEAQWEPCTPKSVAVGDFGGFSAAAYFFGRKLHEELKVPVGLIDSSWGGTMIEPWTAPVGFKDIPRFRYISKALDEQTQTFLKAQGDPVAAAAGKLDSSRPTAIYNAMIHPLIPFAIHGALWYQGEANLSFISDGANYTVKQEALIEGWRKLWKEGDFPFYFVQLAPLDDPGSGYKYLPYFWEAQSAAQAIPNTGMVITRDITASVKDIHPVDKKDVGLRFAALALHDAFGRKDIVCRGPDFKSMKIDGNKAVITFEHCDGGLATRDGKAPDYFTIAGDDGVFVQAEAAITGPDEVTVTSGSVAKPVAVRFAWNPVAMPNLKNGAGLPADAFRTDHPLLKSLAFGKPVTSSCDAQDDHVPENIVDGIADDTSSWQAGSPNQWVQIDLEKVQTIDRVVVYPYYDGTRYYQYTVEASEDGKQWTTVADMSKATTPETVSGHEHHFKAMPARYVRVNMIQNSANPGVHLNEVLVFGPDDSAGQ